MTERAHIPVLAAEVAALLTPSAGETVVDCTAGLGGHAERLAALIGSAGTLVLNDLDDSNLRRATARCGSLPDGPSVVANHGNFAELPVRLQALGITADVVLADLGFASNQVDDPARGFSFRSDGPLDMRLNPSAGPSAAELVNTLPESELESIIREFGEERHARRIAEKIVRERQGSPISTTARLAAIVRSAQVFGGARSQSIDPATRTFQALRIAVNDELGNLHALLRAIERAARNLDGATPGGGRSEWLRANARIGIISFHSLEDRPVKQSFAKLAETGLARLRTRGPVVAGEEECAGNPRSRSAKLRVLQLGGEN